MTNPQLSVRRLTVDIVTGHRQVRILHGLSLDVAAGETVALVGESGSGKSMTASAIMGLLPGGAQLGGSVRFAGVELLDCGEKEYRRLRGGRLALIPQEPLSALNPVLTIGAQLAEVLRVHGTAGSRRGAWERARELLELVEISAARSRLHDYPHEMSGGMRQRVLIAMAIANDPALIIADEPTTALDVTVQAQILELLKDIQRRNGLAMLLITHDVGIVAGYADRVATMYAGEVVEAGRAGEVLATPVHPYTAGLLASVPQLHERNLDGLEPIPGLPPSPEARPAGCAFSPRCPHVMARCRDEAPVLKATAPHRTAACHLVEGGANG